MEITTDYSHLGATTGASEKKVAKLSVCYGAIDQASLFNLQSDVSTANQSSKFKETVANKEVSSEEEDSLDLSLESGSDTDDFGSADGESTAPLSLTITRSPKKAGSVRNFFIESRMGLNIQAKMNSTEQDQSISQFNGGLDTPSCPINKHL